MAFTVTSTRIYSNPEDEDLAKSWGLLGFFPGDEELLQEMKWVQQELDISNNSNSNSNSQKMKRLYQLLDRLPMASRQALATQILAHHTQRDEIIQELLDYAFEPQEQHAQEQDTSSKKDAFHDPDDFVLLWTDSTRFMNPHRYHIFQTVLLLLNFVSVPVALRLCRAYFASASTQHTGALLAYCTKQDTQLFGNQELQRLFEAAPLLVQKQVLTTCRSMAPSSPVDNNHDASSPNHPRQEFLLHVWHTMYDLDPQIIFWCSSDVVQKYLLLVPTSSNNKEKPSSSSFKTNTRLTELGMQRWSAHAAVYIVYLQQRLTEEPNPLLRGTLWKGQLLPLLVKAKSTLQWSHSQTHTIQSLLMDYTVLELAQDTPRLAREHLQRLAIHYQQSNGKDPTALLQYPHIQRVVLSPIRPLTKPERLQKTLQAIQETNWKDFQTFHSGISYNNLPFRSIFQQATLVDLWTAITGKNQTMPPDYDSLLSSPKDDDHIRLMQFFYRSDFTSHRERSFTIDALFEWGEWHLRSTPDKLTTKQLEWFATNHHYQSQFDDAECTQKKAVLKQLWNAWYQSLTSRYFTNGLVNTTIERVLEAQRTCLTMDEKSKITLDVRYFHVLFKIAMRGIETMPHWTAEGQLDHWKRLLTLMGKLEESGHLPVVANLNATMSHVLEKHFFALLKDLLFFDLPSDPKRYAKTDGQIHVFQNQAAWIAVYLVKHPNNDALRKEFVSILINILKQATNGGHHDSEALVEIKDPQTNKIVFDYYDVYMHNRVIRMVVSQLKTVLANGLDALPAVQREAFAAIVHYEFTIRDPKWDRNPDEVLGLLMTCQSLSPSVWELEKDFLLEKTAVIMKAPSTRLLDKRKVSHYLQSMGLFAQFLSGIHGNSLSDDLKADLTISLQSFDYEPYREKLRDATTGVDAEARVQGHVDWLRSAVDSKSLASLSTAIQYTEHRIRNEAGLYRRKVYQFVASILRPNIIKPSLDGADTLIHVQAICECILSMLSNDLNKRDSVQRFCFARIPGETLREIAAHGMKAFNTSNDNRKSIRQTWIRFSMKMHWAQTKSTKGDDGLQNIDWPVALSLETTNWISYDSFISAYPREKSFLQVAKLRTRFNVKEKVKSDLGLYLGPSELIDDLVEAMEDLWKDKFPLLPFLSWPENGWVPDDDSQRSALKSRLIGLLKIGGSAWESVPLLTNLFDRTFERLESAPFKHFSFASDILQTVMNILRGSGSRLPHTYLVPRVANALDRIVRCGVKSWAHFNHSQMQSFQAAWKDQVMGQQECSWTQVPIPSSRFQFFLAQNSFGCEPPMCSSLSDKREMTHARLVLARELLAMTPSAIWMNDVQECLLGERQDIVASLFGDDSILKGPFAVKNKGGLEGLLYSWVKPSTLNSLPPALTLKYSESALVISNSEDEGIAQRVTAIECFCNAPTTGHMDVMRALEKELDDPLREAIIIKSFSLDAPWHVVSFLLKTSLADKKKQRMCSSLLSHIRKYCSVDTVVDLLAMILGGNQRQTLGANLLKSIIRMLFDNRTTKAEILLQAEWERSDTILDIRLIFILTCMEAITTATRATDVDWEWGIIKSLAKQTDEMPNELLIHLFSACWRGCDPWSSVFDFIPLHSEEEKNETLLFLHTHRPSSWKRYRISNDVARSRYIEVIQLMEDATTDPFWKTLASVYKLTFQVACPRTDETVMKYLKECILRLPLPIADWDLFLVKVWAALFGSACVSNLTIEKAERPNQEWEKILKISETATTFGTTYGILLSKSLDIPIRDKNTREQIILALTTLSSQVRRFLEANGWAELIKAFKDDISLLSSDSEALHSALTGTTLSGW